MKKNILIEKGKIVVKNVENDGDNSQNEGYCVNPKHFQIDLVGHRFFLQAFFDDEDCCKQEKGIH